MADSLSGHFLIASKHLRDPNFFRTVVLMIEHGENGAMGLVVNRPSPVSVSRALEGHFEIPDDGNMVFTGGPVDSSALLILHDSPELKGEDAAIVADLYVGSSAEVFEQIMRDASTGVLELTYRVYAGYAGWAPEQLEGEIARGDWVTMPASKEFVFHEDPYSLWGLLLKKSAPLAGINMPPVENPEWN
jgi:putative transcriptional regulator